jgi:hypothetical protein
VDAGHQLAHVSQLFSPDTRLVNPCVTILSHLWSLRYRQQQRSGFIVGALLPNDEGAGRLQHLYSHWGSRHSRVFSCSTGYSFYCHYANFGQIRNVIFSPWTIILLVLSGLGSPTFTCRGSGQTNVTKPVSAHRSNESALHSWDTPSEKVRVRKSW